MTFEEWWKDEGWKGFDYSAEDGARQAWQAALRHAAEQVRQMPVWKMCAEDVARAIERG